VICDSLLRLDQTFVGHVHLPGIPHPERYKYPGALTLAQLTDIHDACQVPRVPSPAAVRIGELISDARRRRGITQDELAVLTQIDSSNIRGYEKGRSMMGIPTLIRIADALKVEPGELLNDVTPDMFNVLATDARRRAR